MPCYLLPTHLINAWVSFGAVRLSVLYTVYSADKLMFQNFKQAVLKELSHKNSGLRCYATLDRSRFNHCPPKFKNMFY